MFATGVGAALVQSQLSGAVVALAIVMRQGGLAIGIALLGAALGTERDAGVYTQAFVTAAVAAVVGSLAALMLLPKPSPRPEAHQVAE